MVDPIKFFKKTLRWIDGSPLVFEPYRQETFRVVHTTVDEEGRRQYTMAVIGRAKKNAKTLDAVLSGFYCMAAEPSPWGNQVYIFAKDKDQAADDLDLAKKLRRASPVFSAATEEYSDRIVMKDDSGFMQILPYDAPGSHGKTYRACIFDEIHTYRDWDLLEAMQPDPSRPDYLIWITSYASIFNSPGAPLFDLCQQGRRGDDPRMYFSWYSGDYTTDPDFQDKEPEARANPSMESWGNPGYLEQQRKRLPTHRYRRLHLNFPGMPEGAFYDAEKVMDSVVEGRKVLTKQDGVRYRGFVDMSGGSSDDACLGISHLDKDKKKVVLDLVVSQTPRPPFDPRRAVAKFAKILKVYGVHRVIGDAYAGQTFRKDFEENGITYLVCKQTKSQLYESLEPMINAGEIELLDIPKLQEQILGLTVKGTKIDHLSGEHYHQTPPLRSWHLHQTSP